VGTSVTPSLSSEPQAEAGNPSTAQADASFSASPPLGRIYWPGWLGALLIVAMVWSTSGCAASKPFVPAEIYEQVNEDGREWTYDTAWQNIRKLNADLARQEYENLAKESLLIVSQMERLDRGSASALSSRSITEIVEEIQAQANERDTADNLRQLIVAAQWLQDSFDNGDFSSATLSAIEVAVISRMMESN